MHTLFCYYFILKVSFIFLTIPFFLVTFLETAVHSRFSFIRSPLIGYISTHTQRALVELLIIIDAARAFSRPRESTRP